MSYVQTLQNRVSSVVFFSVLLGPGKATGEKDFVSFVLENSGIYNSEQFSAGLITLLIRISFTNWTFSGRLTVKI
jgi:hypothetical protein